jgi:hypothetical protein
MDMEFKWDIEAKTGYKPKTKIWKEFCVAEIFGETAINGVYGSCMAHIKKCFPVIYLTELSLVLSWKMWEHHDKGNIEIGKLYESLWREVDQYANDYLDGTDIQYYLRTTD